jgi:hypothetical protein
MTTTHELPSSDATEQLRSHEPQPIATEELPADVALELLAHHSIYLMGHGTGREEDARNIIKDGLYTRHADLSSTAYGLETIAENPAASDHNKSLLQAWPQHNLKYVVTLGVERLPESEIPNDHYLESIVQPRNEAHNVDSEHGTYLIGRNFVAGYFDVEKDTFIPNPEYNPRYDPHLLDTAVNLEVQKWHGGQDTGPDSLGRDPVGGMAIPPQVQVRSGANLKGRDHFW